MPPPSGMLTLSFRQSKTLASSSSAMSAIVDWPPLATAASELPGLAGYSAWTLMTSSRTMLLKHCCHWRTATPTDTPSSGIFKSSESLIERCRRPLRRRASFSLSGSCPGLAFCCAVIFGAARAAIAKTKHSRSAKKTPTFGSRRSNTASRSSYRQSDLSLPPPRRQHDFADSSGLPQSPKVHLSAAPSLHQLTRHAPALLCEFLLALRKRPLGCAASGERRCSSLFGRSPSAGRRWTSSASLN